MLHEKYIHDSSIKKAAEEVMSNIKLLIVAGYHNEAIALSDMLLNSGPWLVNSKTGQINEVQELHQVLCWLCKRPCPSIAEEPALDLTKLEMRAEQKWSDKMDDLLMSDRLQVEPAGSVWSDTFFQKLDQMEQCDGKFKEYGLFLNDVDWILKHRLRRKTDRSVPSLLPDCISEILPGYNTNKEILLDPITCEYESHWLTDKLATCSEVFGEKSGCSGIGYMEVRIYLMQLIIDLLDGNEISEKKQIMRLLSDEEKHDLIELNYWRVFRDRIIAGAYRQTVGINDEHVTSYLDAVSHRAGTIKAPIIEYRQSSSAVDLKNFQSISQDTLLENSEFIELPVPLSNQKVLATKVDHKSALPLWKEALSLLKDTGRWPVLVIGWSGVESDWKASLKEEDLFDRDLFKDEHYDGDRIGLSVQEIITGACNLDLSEAYHDLAKDNYESINEYLSYQIDGDELDSLISLNYDTSVVGAFAEASKQLGKRIFEKRGVPEPFPITWFEPTKTDPVFLLLMPTENSWQIPAYLQWYGAESSGTEVTVAQLKEWHVKYGAELVCHYGTMLQLTVKNRPDSIDDALELAYAQDSLASCTLSGSTIAEYAVSLLHSDIWFLHERP